MTDDTQEKSFNYAQTLSSLNRYYRQGNFYICKFYDAVLYCFSNFIVNYIQSKFLYDIKFVYYLK